MSNESECLTYPDLVCCLDGTSGRCAPEYVEEHVYSCIKCRAVLKTMQELILDEATPEEMIVLDKLDNGLLNSSPSTTFRKVNLRSTAYEIVFIRM